jgi:hypothetical protein
MNRFKDDLPKYKMVLGFRSNPIETLASIAFTYHLMKKLDEETYNYNRNYKLIQIILFYQKCFDHA